MDQGWPPRLCSLGCVVTASCFAPEVKSTDPRPHASFTFYPRCPTTRPHCIAHPVSINGASCARTQQSCSWDGTSRLAGCLALCLSASASRNIHCSSAFGRCSSAFGGPILLDPPLPLCLHTPTHLVSFLSSHGASTSTKQSTGSTSTSTHTSHSVLNLALPRFPLMPRLDSSHFSALPCDATAYQSHCSSLCMPCCCAAPRSRS